MQLKRDICRIIHTGIKLLGDRGIELFLYCQVFYQSSALFGPVVFADRKKNFSFYIRKFISCKMRFQKDF